jgi:hypothetical protein
MPSESSLLLTKLEKPNAVLIINGRICRVDTTTYGKGCILFLDYFQKIAEPHSEAVLRMDMDTQQMIIPGSVAHSSFHATPELQKHLYEKLVEGIQFIEEPTPEKIHAIHMELLRARMKARLADAHNKERALLREETHRSIIRKHVQSTVNAASVEIYKAAEEGRGFATIDFHIPSFKFLPPFDPLAVCSDGLRRSLKEYVRWLLRESLDVGTATVTTEAASVGGEEAVEAATEAEAEATETNGEWKENLLELWILTQVQKQFPHLKVSIGAVDVMPKIIIDLGIDMASLIR